MRIMVDLEDRAGELFAVVTTPGRAAPTDTPAPAAFLSTGRSWKNLVTGPGRSTG
jgi:hypothetical protein